MEEKKNGSVVSKLIIYAIAAAVIFFVVQFFIVNGSATGKNVKIQGASDSSVSYCAVCPYCKHVNSGKAVNISKGERYEGQEICSSCKEIFEITIKR